MNGGMWMMNLATPADKPNRLGISIHGVTFLLITKEQLVQ